MRNTNTMGLLLAGSALCGGMLFAGAALAQGSDSVVSEVIVTSSKREQRVVDVPYAVTAVSGGEISARGATDIKDLQYSIPGLAIQGTNPGSDRIQLRGVNAGTGTGLPIVGIYVDEVGVSVDQQQRDGGFPLIDLERVEVLRGPQGTLYGQGSLAGTIRFITKNPSLVSPDGYVEGNVYSQGEGGVGYKINGAVGGPIIKDVLGLRVTASYDNAAGWVDYPNAGRKDANEVNTYFIRSKLLWTPNDRLTASLLHQYYDMKADTTFYTSGGDPLSSASGRLDPVSDTFHLANLIVDYDLGFATLTASTGYQDRDYAFQFAFPFPAGVGQDTNFKQLTQEVRLSSNGEGPFRYTVGAWYRDYESDTVRSAPTAFGFFRRTGTDPVNSKALALFGDVTYVWNEALETSVGLRYYEDERELITVTPTPFKDDAEFDSLSPRFNVKYNWTPDVSTYVQAAKGFRSGGFNSNAAVPDFAEESVWSYEVGTKAALFDGRLFIDGAVYYLDYSDRQSQSIVFVGATPFSVTRNGGAASGPGIELGLNALLPAGLRLDLTASYNDITYDTTNLEVDKGERFAYVPPFTGSLSLSQSFPVSDALKGFWRADYQHSDGYEAIFRGLAGGVRIVQAAEKTSAIDLVNLRAGIETKDYTLSFDVFNLTEEDAVTFPYTGFGPGNAAYVRPRSYGVTFRWNYN